MVRGCRSCTTTAVYRLYFEMKSRGPLATPPPVITIGLAVWWRRRISRDFEGLSVHRSPRVRMVCGRPLARNRHGLIQLLKTQAMRMRNDAEEMRARFGCNKHVPGTRLVLHGVHPLRSRYVRRRLGPPLLVVHIQLPSTACGRLAEQFLHRGVALTRASFESGSILDPNPSPAVRDDPCLDEFADNQRHRRTSHSQHRREQIVCNGQIV